jgi:hypothetical protein
VLAQERQFYRWGAVNSIELSLLLLLLLLLLWLSLGAAWIRCAWVVRSCKGCAAVYGKRGSSKMAAAKCPEVLGSSQRGRLLW